MSDVQALDRWFTSAPELFNPEVAGGLEGVLQIDVTGETELHVHCAVTNRSLTITRGIHPSPTLTVRGDASKLLELFSGTHEVLNSLVPFFPAADQVVIVTPHDPQFLMWFVLIFRRDAQAVSDYRKLMVGNIESWSYYRDFWLEQLKKHGLSPEQSLMDVGCGTLRAGIPIIGYLDAGNYCGIDIRAEIISEAEKELTLLHLDAKRASLHCADVGTIDLGKKFDVILAASVLFNLDDEVLYRVFAAGARHLKGSGTLVGQVLLRDQHPSFIDNRIRWLGFPVVGRSLEFYEKAATANGLRLAENEPWNAMAILTFRLA